MSTTTTATITATNTSNDNTNRVNLNRYPSSLKKAKSYDDCIIKTVCFIPQTSGRGYLSSISWMSFIPSGETQIIIILRIEPNIMHTVKIRQLSSELPTKKQESCTPKISNKERMRKVSTRQNAVCVCQSTTGQINVKTEATNPNDTFNTNHVTLFQGDYDHTSNFEGLVAETWDSAVLDSGASKTVWYIQV